MLLIFLPNDYLFFFFFFFQTGFLNVKITFKPLKHNPNRPKYKFKNHYSFLRFITVDSNLRPKYSCNTLTKPTCTHKINK
jgi:hypothetical protein